jgi:flavodoxin
MKILIAYYSRTGTTKKIAETLAEKLGADVEEIRDTVDRRGIRGYLTSGRDAMKKNLTKLEVLKFSPKEYDLVIVGTPIWGWNMSVPIRTYLTENKDQFPKVAFFCTMGGSGDEKAFLEMEKITDRKPLATLGLKTVEVVKSNFYEKLEKFVGELIGQ